MKVPPHKFRTGKAANGYRHGGASRGKIMPEYRTWAGLKNRCLNPNSPKFPIYGGRGIMVCDRWKHSFLCFLEDMGKKPSPLHSIERIDNNGNYEPSNCVWATNLIQSRNRTSNKVIRFNGSSKTMTEFANEFGLKVGTLWQRLKSGWSVKDSLTEPLWRIRK